MYINIVYICHQEEEEELEVGGGLILRASEFLGKELEGKVVLREEELEGKMVLR